MSYRPGLHLLLNIGSIGRDKLTDATQWNKFIERQIRIHGLTLVGEVNHVFPEGGYTAVHCLTESHISIHTWPEYGLCTCDAFLSNFQRDNHNTVRAIGDAIVQYFGSDNVQRQEVER